jgi:hypothetical protein
LTCKLITQQQAFKPCVKYDDNARGSLVQLAAKWKQIHRRIATAQAALAARRHDAPLPLPRARTATMENTDEFFAEMTQSYFCADPEAPVICRAEVTHPARLPGH